jgi:hypothetical protein
MFSSAQLFVFAFPPNAKFEGQLGGAIGRFETGGTLRILGAMFVQRDAETRELVAFDICGDGAGGLIGPVLDFRLDSAARQRATERALASDSGGIPPETLRQLGTLLAPGAAVAALLIEHVWAEALSDAIVRSDGVPLVSESVEARTLAELAPELLAAAGGHGTSVDSP